MIGDAATAAVVLNNNKYLAIQLNTYGEKGLLARRVLCLLDKESGQWESFIIKGNSNRTITVPPYIIYRVG